MPDALDGSHPDQAHPGCTQRMRSRLAKTGRSVARVQVVGMIEASHSLAYRGIVRMRVAIDPLSGWDRLASYR